MAPPSAVFFMLRLAITSPQKGKQETGSHCLEPLSPKSFFCSRSKFSRKCISTGESSFMVRSLNLSYSLLAFSFANLAEILPAWVRISFREIRRKSSRMLIQSFSTLVPHILN